MPLPSESGTKGTLPRSDGGPDIQTRVWSVDDRTGIPDLIDFSHRIPELRQPRIRVLPDEFHAPGKSIGTTTGYARSDEILRYIEGTMGAAPHVYSVLVWYNVDGDRVVYQIVNRADNPEPGAPPIDFPSWQVIQYAGDGRWKSEEDIWVMGEMKTFARTYSEAALRHPQSLDERLSRKDWGPWVDWARPEPGHVARPSWYDRPDWKPLAYNDIDFGIRSH